MVTILMFFLLVVLMGGSISNIDYSIYENMYNLNNFTKDIGFGVLINISNTIGLNFLVFKLIISLFGLSLIYHSLGKLKISKYYFSILYLIYPFFFDVVQIRNFLTMAIVVFAISLQIKNKSRKTITFIFLILIAASIQKIALAYLPIILVSNRHKNKLSYLITGILITSSMALVLSGNASNVVSQVINYVSNYFVGLENYVEVNTELGWIISIFQQVMNVFLVFSSKKIFISLNKNTLENVEETLINKQYKFIQLILNINILMLLYVPLFTIDENFTRIIRNIMVINLFVYSLCIEKIMSFYREQGHFLVKYLIYTGGIYIYQIYLFFLLNRSYWDTIVMPIIKDNWIW